MEDQPALAGEFATTEIDFACACSRYLYYSRPFAATCMTKRGALLTNNETGFEQLRAKVIPPLLRSIHGVEYNAIQI